MPIKHLDNGYKQGGNEDFNRDYAPNEARFFRFPHKYPKKLTGILMLTVYVKYVILYERCKVR